jgi:predicted dehydrogenase
MILPQLTNQAMAASGEALNPTVAVLGCGYWGQNLVRNFQDLGALRAVGDPSEKGRSRARELAPEALLFEDFHRVLRDPTIEAVVIATPAETHFALVQEAIENGKHVLCEKPLSLHYRQAVQLERMASAANCTLMVGHLLEYHPAIARLKEMVEDRVLGHIQYIYSNRLNFGKVRTEENALWSFAPHDFAVILRLVGEEPLEVNAVGGNYITPNLADVTVSTLHFRTGIRAHIYVSWINPFKEQKLVVVGSRKMAVFNDVVADGKLTLYDQQVDLNGREPVLHKGSIETVPIASDEPLRLECQHFLDVVRNGTTPLTDGKSGLRVLKVLEACQISLQLNGRPILVSDVRQEA